MLYVLGYTTRDDEYESKRYIHVLATIEVENVEQAAELLGAKVKEVNSYGGALLDHPEAAYRLSDEYTWEPDIWLRPMPPQKLGLDLLLDAAQADHRRIHRIRPREQWFQYVQSEAEYEAETAAEEAQRNADPAKEEAEWQAEYSEAELE